MTIKEHPAIWHIETYPADVKGFGPRVVAELLLNGTAICQAISKEECDLYNPSPAHETQALEALYLNLRQKLGQVWDLRS